MADNHSKEVRSYNMSMIRSKNTKPEIIVRKYLFNHGFRYRLNVKELPGKPDIVLKKYRTVIFINGCFWHGHQGCRYFIIPKTRTDWWTAKIYRTIERDKKEYDLLKKSKWDVIIIWECELKPRKREETLKNLVSHLINKLQV